MISLDLPVPDGVVSLRRVSRAGGEPQQIDEMKSVLDFVAVSYAGKLAQWQAFLSEKDLLPPMLTPDLLRFEYDKSFAYRSARMRFNYTPALQKIDKDNRVFIDLGFFSEAGKPVCDVTGVVVHEDNEGKTEVGAFRHAAPSGDLDEKYGKSWVQSLRHEHPYDAVAEDQDGVRMIRAVYGPVDPKPAPDVLYTFNYRSDAGTAQDKMKSKLDLLLKSAKVDER